MAEDMPAVIGLAGDMEALPLLLSSFVFLWLFFSSFQLSLPDGSSAEPWELQETDVAHMLVLKRGVFLLFFFSLCGCNTHVTQW